MTSAQKARLAITATKLGLPVPSFLTLVKQIGQFKCPFCKLGVQVLNKLDVMGEEKALDILTRVLEAKKEKNHVALAQLVEEFNGRRST